MPGLTANPFGRRAIPWGTAVLIATLVEGVLLLVLLPGMLHSGGADNPLWFYLAAALQFPASLLFVPTYSLIAGHGEHVLVALSVAAALVVLLELALLTLLIRRPWRHGQVA